MFGEDFNICTVKYMRGYHGLQTGEKSSSPFGDELPDDYFVDCYSDWLDFRIYASPERKRLYIRNELEKRCRIDKELAKKKYAELSVEFEVAFIKAIVA